jgi:hypothetical protein
MLDKIINASLFWPFVVMVAIMIVGYFYHDVFKK